MHAICSIIRHLIPVMFIRINTQARPHAGTRACTHALLYIYACQVTLCCVMLCYAHGSYAHGTPDDGDGAPTMLILTKSSISTCIIRRPFVGGRQVITFVGGRQVITFVGGRQVITFPIMRQPC